MRIPDNKIQEISDKAEIVNIVGEYVKLANKQGRWLGLCPFHTEKTPSFNVSPEKNAFYCFGCGKGGSVFNFIMEMEKLNFVEAVKLLAEKTGVQIEIAGEDNIDYKLKEAKIELHNRVAGSFHHILMNSEKGQSALSYLQKRGLSDDSIKEFELGFAPNDGNWLRDFLYRKNYSHTFLNKSGLFSKKGYPLFWNRVVFPITDTRRNIVGFSGRALSDSGPKYINSPESDIYHKSSLLYGIKQSLEELKKSGCFVLCEGNVDVIALHQAGIKNAIAPLGTSFTPGQARLLKRYAKSGIILFDGDSAGRKAAVKAGMICEREGLEIKVAALSEGDDPADILQKKGALFLKKRVGEAVNLFDFLLDYFTTQISIDQPNGKTEVIQNLKDYLDIVESPIKKEACFDKLSEKLNIQKKIIILEYSRLKNGRFRKVAKKQAPDSLVIDEELFLMMAVFFNHDLFDDLQEKLKIVDLVNPYAKKLYRVLQDSGDLTKGDITLLLERINDEKLKDLLQRKSFTSEFNLNRTEIINDAVNNLKLNRLKKKADKINKEIVKAEGNQTDHLLIAELIKEKAFIDKEILELRKNTGER